MGETTTVNITPTANVETQEYRDSMVQKIDQANAAPQPTLQPTTTTEEVKQEKILGKFNSQEDLIKSYQELEKKLSSNTSSTKTENKNPLQAQAKTEQPSAISSVFQAAEQEFNETGQISDNTLSSLEKSGLPKQYVDNYLKGLEALGEQFQNKAYSITKGEEQYKAMTDWVANNLTEEEVETFNRGVASDDSTALFTIKGMYARYNTESKEPKINLGQSSSSNSTGERYESVSQLKEDMKNPLYQKDPAFRQKVELKLSRSNIL
jgi:predicted transcriptional regulator with HTH domain